MFMSPVGAIGAVSLTLLHYSYNSDFEALMIVIGFFLPEYFGILSQFKKEKYTYGYNFVLSYSNTTEFYQDVEYGRYGLSGDANVTEMDVRERQTGDYGVNNVLLSTLAGVSLKTLNSNYKFTIL